VSHTESVSPETFPPLPVRPPSKPSRAPWFIFSGIALFCLLMFGAALALFLWSREKFDSKDLKKATSIEIAYMVKSPQTKTVTINDPATVKRLLDALDIINTQPGAQVALTNQPYLIFHLAGGKQARLVFVNQQQIDRANWGLLYVTPTFYQKVNEELSRAEGKPIDIMRPNN
jgi:hypothetical protein